MGMIKRGVSSKIAKMEILGGTDSGKFKCNVCQKNVSLSEKNTCNIPGCPLKGPGDNKQEETE